MAQMNTGKDYFATAALHQPLYFPKDLFDGPAAH